jgi:hypothetical protein
VLTTSLVWLCVSITTIKCMSHQSMYDQVCRNLHTMRWVVENMGFQKASNSFQQDNGKKTHYYWQEHGCLSSPPQGWGVGVVLESFSLFVDDGKGQQCELHWVSYSWLRGMDKNVKLCYPSTWLKWTSAAEIERDAHLILRQILISSSLSFPLISFPCFCFFYCQILWNFSGDTAVFLPLTQGCLCFPSHLRFFF